MLDSSFALAIVMNYEELAIFDKYGDTEILARFSACAGRYGITFYTSIESEKEALWEAASKAFDAHDKELEER